MEKAIKRGDELRGTEQYEEAVKQYRYAAEQYPNDKKIVSAYLKMGDVYLYNINDLEVANEQYGEIIRRRPLSPEALSAYERKTDIATMQGKPQAAIDNLSMILRYFPDDPRRNSFHHKLAKNYIAIGNYHQAQIEFKEILDRKDLEPALKVQVIFDLAESYFMAGNLILAKKYYNMVLDEHPDSELAFNAKWGLSHCLEEDGDLKGALELQRELKKENKDSGVLDDKLIDQKVEQLKKRERTSGRVMEDKKEIETKKKKK